MIFVLTSQPVSFVQSIDQIMKVIFATEWFHGFKHSRQSASVTQRNIFLRAYPLKVRYSLFWYRQMNPQICIVNHYFCDKSLVVTHLSYSLDQVYWPARCLRHELPASGFWGLCALWMLECTYPLHILYCALYAHWLCAV